jgi:hypothetical protein
MSAKYYSGVGSRETPPHIRKALTLIARELEALGYTLRSGGADGADMAFEEGVTSLKEIYLPWKGFNGNSSKLFTVTQEAITLARTIHAAPDRLTQVTEKFHGRNCYQVLGLDLKTPSDFLICYTKDGVAIGGTRTAIVLAQKNNIPVLNLGKFREYQSTDKLVEAFHNFLMIYGNT